MSARTKNASFNTTYKEILLILVVSPEFFVFSALNYNTTYEIGLSQKNSVSNHSLLHILKKRGQKAK